MVDFNAQFHTNWKRIQVDIRPIPNLEFMFYLNSINPDIPMMIWPLNQTTLLGAYSVVNAENNLIDVEKFPPFPIIPIFLEILLPTQEMPSTSATNPP